MHIYPLRRTALFWAHLAGVTKLCQKCDINFFREVESRKSKGITYLPLHMTKNQKSGREKKCLNYSKILELCGDTCRQFCVKIRWVGTLSIMPTIRFHKV